MGSRIEATKLSMSATQNVDYLRSTEDDVAPANLRLLISWMYPLVMTNIANWKPWPIETDNFPSELNHGFSSSLC